MTEPLAVYIHWPWCVAKCPYCDFNSRAVKAVDVERWARALEAELARLRALVPGRPVASLFFGGGTPSLMPPELVARLIEAVGPETGAEITLEANPGTVERGRFDGFARAGVNRLSLGVQSLDDDALAFLGRIHSGAEARAAIDLAGETFARVNLDFIYALPGQTVADWRAALKEALGLGAEHLSLYQLTIEPGTPFHGLHERGRLALPDEDIAVGLWRTTRELTAAAGLPAYEVSNHARPGRESRHNLVYWTGGDYIGLGPGAHGRLTTTSGVLATAQIAAPERWLAAVEAGAGAAEEVILAPAERAAEMVMMGLRLTAGIDRARLKARSGVALDDALDGAAVATLVDEGLLTADETGLRLTEAGRPLLDAVLAEIVAS